MTIHTYPRIRTLLVMMVVVLVAFIVDLKLRNTRLEFDFGSVSHRWISQAYISLAEKLSSETQPKSPASAPAPSHMPNSSALSARSHI